MKTNHQPRLWKSGSYFAAIIIFLFSAMLPARSNLIQPVSIISAPAVAPAGGNGDSGLAIISKDGRYVLFASTANNLTPTNNNLSPLPARFNVFLRDCVNNTSTLVSVNQSGTGGGNGDSFPTGISTNGQFALFESSASDLVVNDTNNANDIFVRDLVHGTTTLVSVGIGGDANGTSRGSVISPDGRYVAFASAANNLVSGDTNNIADVFIRDLQAGTTTLVSVGATTYSIPPTVNIASSSESPEITPDGRYVAFYSSATNLVSGVNTAGEIYVRDLVAGKTFWASTNARAIFQSVTGGTNAVSCNYSISDDGQFVGFEVCTNPVSGTARGVVLRYSLQTGLTDIINTNASVQYLSYELIHNLSMTPDGRFIAFVAGQYPTINTSLSATNAIYLWDAQTGSNTLVIAKVSNNLTPTNGLSDSPVVSADGRFVSFISSANTLVTNSFAGTFHVYICDLQAGVTQLIDVNTNGIGVGVDATTVPAMSADGSVIAFDSANLLTDNRHLVHDVFARNVTAGTTSLVSAANPALRSQTPDGVSGLTSLSISSNGQFVAFYSDADNLVANDTNSCRDVFVRDLVAGTNYLVSVSTNGVAGDGFSTDAAISGNGRYVAFTSLADNLVSGDNNSSQDVFVRDLQAGTTTLVSVSTDGVHPGSGDSFSPTISADGRYVLFYSVASNLVANSYPGTENLFFRDMQAGTMYPLTSFGVTSAAMTPDGQSVVFIGAAVGISGTQLYVWSSQLKALIYTNSATYFGSVLAISPNGQKLAYLANQTPSLYVADLVAQTVTTISSNRTFPSHIGLRFSNDGNHLVYAMATNSTANQNVYRYDFLTGTNLLVSQNFNATGNTNGNSDSPSISPDGRFIAYRSFAPNIVPSDAGNAGDMFIYDASNNATVLASVNLAGLNGADSRSLKPVFSPDGQTLFFESWAADISTNDFNNASDIFALNLTSFPLLTSGGGGATNAATNFFAQLTPAGASNSSPTISWPLAAGKTYQVQYKTNLTDAVWLNLPANISFIGNSGYASDPLPSSSQRFYRIVLSQ